MSADGKGPAAGGGETHGIAASTTRLAALKTLGEVFRAAGIATAQRDARLLLLDAAGLSHPDLIRAPREALGPRVAAKLASHVSRRLTREPVARILGEWEFWSLPFTLSPATLVPRPDSETVVAAALLALKDRRKTGRGVRVLDLGVGSGCLLVALLHEMPEATGVGADVSPEALETARFNAARNGVGDRAAFVESDWGRAIEGRFDCIVSNPPYIANAVIDGLEPEVRVHDPRLALAGGPDGLAAYRAIADALPALMAPGAVVALEIGSDQDVSVTELFRQRGFEVEGPFADFGSRPRALVIRATASA
ncbi:peptide chain release factor N(5)-glutamine methyltransferase [Alsobacter sp. SYSU M60028]|uniref:Release factor glutamine methyltransferase n=1 Tax=Alsobacter ponti TaxID=2962936 RepID=A0ABT1LBT8_9HYPH|nr:peptide chain release factor N(5)-glutamine methyltransferase [Alsobacter ponti]MCP8938952.1 peptide chain release factor N(5)-glutamine methyltransferase [Alsobacter ponti]